MRQSPEIASLRRRLLARAVNIAAGLGLLGAFVGLVIGLGLALPKLRWRPSLRWNAPKWGASRWRLILTLTGALTSAWARNRRGIGYRVVGLRRVNARTGGPVTVRSALIRFAITTLRDAAVKRIVAPLLRRRQQRADALQPRLEQIRKLYRDDRERQSEEMMQAYREADVNPAASCLVPLTISIGLGHATGVPLPWSQRGQSLEDWLAGTVVVVER